MEGFDGLFDEVLRESGNSRADLEARVENEAMPSDEAFELVQAAFSRFAKRDDAKDALVGVTLGISIQGEKSNLVVDLKRGPLPKVIANTTPKPAVDIEVVCDSEEQFRGMLSKRINAAKLYQLGQLKVDGSLRSKMKLIGLREFGARLEKEQQELRNKQALDAISWDDEPVSGTFSGELDKKSEWLKQWNTRYFQLDWDEHHRPILSFAPPKKGASRTKIELNSSCVAEPRVTTRRDKTGQAAFAIVDKRKKKDLIVVCASSDQLRKTWLQKCNAAITARSRAENRKNHSPQNDDDSIMGVEEPASGEDNVVSRLFGNSGGNQSSMHDRLESYEAGLIVGGTESHSTYLLRKLSWRVVPLTLGILFVGLKGKSLASNYIPPDRTGRGLLFLASTLVGRFVTNSNFFALFRRRMHVYMVAMYIIADVKLTDMKTATMPPIHREAVWSVKLRHVAERLYFHALKLGGLWVKMGQTFGSRPDVFPPVITNVLRRLQDEVPATPMEFLKPMLEAELGVKVEEVFQSIDPEPLAAASIGQVHRAVLKDGSPVVVKVQHPGVEVKLRQDVHNLGNIMAWVSKIDPKLDLGEIINHWRKNVLGELDFTRELVNMLDIGENLSGGKHPYATVPKAYPEYCSKRVLVMRFVRGVKVTDAVGLGSIGIYGHHARGQLSTDICEAFAHQILIDGCFNADPHAGNVLVASRDDISQGETVHVPVVKDGPKSDEDFVNRPVPVLLDFGLVERFPEHIRLGVARLVYGGSMLDMGAMLQGAREIGVVLRHEDLLDDMSGLQHMFRDVSTTEESRKQVKKRMEAEKKRFQEKGFSNPVLKFPQEIMLFFKSLEMLRGTCSTLEVKQPFVQVFAKFAKMALLDRYPSPERPLVPSPTGVANCLLQRRLEQVLREHELSIVGIQIAYIDEQRDLDFSMAHGVLAEIDHRPVTSSTLFPSVGLAQSIAQICLHLAMAEAPTPSTPAAGALAKSLQAVLEGNLALLPFDPVCLPKVFMTTSAGDWKANLAFMDELLRSETETRTGDVPFELTHAAFAFGWLVMLLTENHFVMPTMGDIQGPRLVEIATQRLDKDIHLGFMSEEEAQTQISSGKVAQLSFPVNKILKDYGIDDVGSMANPAAISGTGDAPPGLEMVQDMVPGLRGKEFWLDPRMLNIPSVLASCSPCSNASCTADALAKVIHAIGNGGFTKGQQVLPSFVAKKIATTVLESKLKGLEPNRVGLQKFSFTDAKGTRRYHGIGQISVGGSMVLTIPELSVTVSVLVNSLTLDRGVTQAVLDAIYAELELCPEGDY